MSIVNDGFQITPENFTVMKLNCLWAYQSFSQVRRRFSYFSFSPCDNNPYFSFSPCDNNPYFSFSPCDNNPYFSCLIRSTSLLTHCQQQRVLWKKPPITPRERMCLDSSKFVVCLLSCKPFCACVRVSTIQLRSCWAQSWCHRCTR